VIVNCPYVLPLDHANEYEGFGGQKPIPGGLDNTPRFLRVVRALRELGGAGPAAKLPEVCFAILKDISDEQMTKRSLVYDIAGRRIWFKTLLCRSVKMVRLAGLDFSPAVPIRMLDMHAPQDGDVTDRFVPLTAEASAAVADEFGAGILQWQKGDAQVPLLNISLVELVRGIQEYAKQSV
jgi:hypothetical protein